MSSMIGDDPNTHELSAMDTIRGAYGELGVGERYTPLKEDELLPCENQSAETPNHV